MKKNFSIILLFLILACRQRYEAPVKAGDQAFLVVEGFINTGKGATTITLSKVNQLSENTVVYIPNALVEVESDNNFVIRLEEKTTGVYSAGQLKLDTARQYRIRIRTQENKEYLSAFAKARITPLIDSISWKREAEGVRIFVNTHDASNQTRYYRWEYEQTWEVRASYMPNVRYTVSPTPNGTTYGVQFIYSDARDDTTRYRCWLYKNSNSILLGSSKKLTQDVISEPLIFIPNATRTLSVLYSVLVKQYALTKEEYEFLEIMKRNTELTGSVFDAQPSQLKGNIESVSHPGEPVIGFVGAYSSEEKRLYISNHQVAGWNFDSGCFQDEIFNHPDTVKNVFMAGLYPTTAKEIGPGNSIIKFNVSPGTCVDCTLLGSNIKPVYWP